mmetsp:Transcript_56735/g.101180  ORF Transcript_56735/g.101180 Transcript_56735/m.101180 type:complete len:219 (-) Transcript_56735:2616-3272(-)
MAEQKEHTPFQMVRDAHSAPTGPKDLPGIPARVNAPVSGVYPIHVRGQPLAGAAALDASAQLAASRRIPDFRPAFRAHFSGPQLHPSRAIGSGPTDAEEQDEHAQPGSHPPGFPSGDPRSRARNGVSGRRPWQRGRGPWRGLRIWRGPYESYTRRRQPVAEQPTGGHRCLQRWGPTEPPEPQESSARLTESACRVKPAKAVCRSAVAQPRIRKGPNEG